MAETHLLQRVVFQFTGAFDLTEADSVTINRYSNGFVCSFLCTTNNNKPATLPITVNGAYNLSLPGAVGPVTMTWQPRTQTTSATSLQLSRNVSYDSSTLESLTVDGTLITSGATKIVNAYIEMPLPTTTLKNFANGIYWSSADQAYPWVIKGDVLDGGGNPIPIILGTGSYQDGGENFYVTIDGVTDQLWTAPVRGTVCGQFNKSRSGFAFTPSNNGGDVGSDSNIVYWFRATGSCRSDVFTFKGGLDLDGHDLTAGIVTVGDVRIKNSSLTSSAANFMVSRIRTDRTPVFGGVVRDEYRCWQFAGNRSITFDISRFYNAAGFYIGFDRQTVSGNPVTVSSPSSLHVCNSILKTPASITIPNGQTVVFQEGKQYACVAYDPATLTVNGTIDGGTAWSDGRYVTVPGDWTKPLPIAGNSMTLSGAGPFQVDLTGYVLTDRETNDAASTITVNVNDAAGSITLNQGRIDVVGGRTFDNRTKIQLTGDDVSNRDARDLTLNGPATYVLLSDVYVNDLTMDDGVIIDGGTQGYKIYANVPGVYGQAYAPTLNIPVDENGVPFFALGTDNRTLTGYYARATDIAIADNGFPVMALNKGSVEQESCSSLLPQTPGKVIGVVVANESAEIKRFIPSRAMSFPVNENGAIIVVNNPNTSAIKRYVSCATFDWAVNENGIPIINLIEE